MRRRASQVVRHAATSATYRLGSASIQAMYTLG